MHKSDDGSLHVPVAYDSAYSLPFSSSRLHSFVSAAGSPGTSRHRASPYDSAAYGSVKGLARDEAHGDGGARGSTCADNNNNNNNNNSTVRSGQSRTASESKPPGRNHGEEREVVSSINSGAIDQSSKCDDGGIVRVGGNSKDKADCDSCTEAAPAMRSSRVSPPAQDAEACSTGVREHKAPMFPSSSSPSPLQAAIESNAPVAAAGDNVGRGGSGSGSGGGGGGGGVIKSLLGRSGSPWNNGAGHGSVVEMMEVEESADSASRRSNARLQCLNSNHSSATAMSAAPGGHLPGSLSSPLSFKSRSFVARRNSSPGTRRSVMQTSAIAPEEGATPPGLNSLQAVGPNEGQGGGSVEARANRLTHASSRFIADLQRVDQGHDPVHGYDRESSAKAAGGEERVSRAASRPSQRMSSDEEGETEPGAREDGDESGATACCWRWPFKRDSDPDADEATWVIDPNKSTLSRYWDSAVMLLMVYTATVTPFEVGIMESSDPLDPLFLINRVVDVLFLFDMFLNFFTAYYNELSGKWEFNHHMIIHRYLKGWFVLDALSTMPYDVIVVVGYDGADGLKMLRFLRILKLTKLLRVLRSGRVLERVEMSIRIDYSSLELLKFLVATLMGMHWLACGLNLIAKSDDSHQYNWIASYFEDMTMGEVTMWDQYIASLYWSAMTITTIGYGDIVPVTVYERIYMTMCMLTGALGYGYIIGAVSGIVATRNQRQNQFYSIMDQLNEYIEYMRISKELQPKLRDYFKYKMKQVDTTSYRALLTMMSPALRGEVAVETNSLWIQNVYCLQNCPHALIIELALHMEHLILPPGELIIGVGDRLSKLFIIKTGIVLSKARVRSSGSVFGEDSLLASNTYSKFAAQSMNFCQVSSIEADVCLHLISLYPEPNQRLRMSRIKYKMIEEVIAYAVAYRTVLSEVKTRRSSFKDVANRLNSASKSHDRLAAQKKLLGGPVLSEETDERVRHYCNKLRSYLMCTTTLEQQACHRAALTIQLRFRRHKKIMAASQKKLPTATYMHCALGKKPISVFESTVLTHMDEMQREHLRTKKALSEIQGTLAGLKASL